MPLRSRNPFADPTLVRNTFTNPYVKELKEGKDLPIVFGKSLQLLKGNWHSFLNIESGIPLIVEIGCYKGQTLVEMASEHPDKFFIGMDITFKRVYLTARKLITSGKKNALCLFANAHYIDEIFSENEISGLVIFYPDPWQKQNQQKHRLLLNGFSGKLKKILKPGAFVWLKTDRQDYFVKSSAELHHNGFSSQNQPNEITIKNYSSPFGTLFKKRNIPLFSGIWENN